MSSYFLSFLFLSLRNLVKKNYRPDPRRKKREGHFLGIYTHTHWGSQIPKEPLKEKSPNHYVLKTESPGILHPRVAKGMNLAIFLSYGSRHFELPQGT